MAGVEEALGGRRVFVEFPSQGTKDWMATCEVLIQEGISAWAFPLAFRDDFPRAKQIFGRRARLGIRDARTPEQVAEAIALGASFVTSPLCSRELMGAASDCPIAVGALTPTEVAAALALGAASVQIVPADALGATYATSLAALFPEASLVPTGRFEAYQADAWLQAGATVVGLTGDSIFTDFASAGDAAGNTATAPDLDAVRRRCQTYAGLLRR